jgi:hypothetical protein
MNKKLFGILLALPFLLIATGALAAADEELVSNSTAMVAAAKENIFAVITANIGTITLVFVGILAIYLIFRFIRRAIGTR